MILFFSFIFCGHFSLSSSLMLSVLFCSGCCRAPFSLLSATFLRFSPSCLSLVTVLILLLFSFLFCGYFSFSSCSVLFVLFCLGYCRAPFSLLIATFSCSFLGPSFTQSSLLSSDAFTSLFFMSPRSWLLVPGVFKLSCSTPFTHF